MPENIGNGIVALDAKQRNKRVPDVATLDSEHSHKSETYGSLIKEKKLLKQQYSDLENTTGKETLITIGISALTLTALGLAIATVAMGFPPLTIAIGLGAVVLGAAATAVYVTKAISNYRQLSSIEKRISELDLQADKVELRLKVVYGDN
ncbi:hypothetical protein [Legionella londiniensis]|uniref:Uncharacterized protein n=1 Tax=Legionella londiniensis TaxID=45068 RepID=A0A0W0VSB3_9GAMM|nr:hypothetical protein [Legionella londiniensis]KTD23006.1 hypothetical protein Llon_0240 [Legionella londiniensis]STX94022.1 Uncharacterised protein [Legionella londiniensis]